MSDRPTKPWHPTNPGIWNIKEYASNTIPWARRETKVEGGPPKKEHPYFTLNTATLANALEGAMQFGEGNSIEQKIYAEAFLFQASSIGASVMEENARLEGSLRSRLLSPAHSFARFYDAGSLFKLIDDGNVEGVKNTVTPQTYTTTAHPNFSRSRELAKKGRGLSTLLGKLTRQEQAYIQEHGELPNESWAAPIKHILQEIKPLLVARIKRSRREELEETVLDVIPTAMQAASEQIAILRQSKSIAGNDPTKDGKFQPAPFTNTKQLEAMAALLPQYNSWFMDGDGKRTCHAYDAELAIPATKRATYQEYLALLKNMPDRLDGFSAIEWKQKLEKEIETLQEVEKLATKRMDALNEMQAFKGAGDPDADPGAKSLELMQLEFATQEASLAYMNKLQEKVEGVAIKDILRSNTANDLRSALGKALDNTYNTKKEPVAVAEDLYMKLTAYGNFSVGIQRRENALQYREAFQYLLANNTEFRLNLARKMDEDVTGNGQVFLARLKIPELYTKAVLLTAEDALHPVKKPEDSLEHSDPAKYAEEKARYDASLKVNECMRKSYDGLSYKIEKAAKRIDLRELEEPAITALEPRELLALDALGSFNMARMYPEAFKGGFITAEFAQPSLKFLKDNVDNPEKIEKEVGRLAQTDMALQIAFAKAMGMSSKIPLIPLHEDPATMRYAVNAQHALRQEPILSYLLQYIGIDTPEQAEMPEEERKLDQGKNADQNAVRCINNNEKMSAYQYLQRFDCTDEEMVAKNMNIEELKNTYVLEGPPDMEACSDITKRAGLIGAEEAEQSVRDKTIAAAGLPITIGNEKYIIVKPKYYGQGGAIARATNVPIDTVQATLQGEHIMSATPQLLAQETIKRTLGRLNLVQSAIRDNAEKNDPNISEAWHTKIRENETQYTDMLNEMPINTGNIMGLKGHGVSPSQRDLIDKVTAVRIASTRDDVVIDPSKPSSPTRYDMYLNKYGIPTVNNSARPDAKGVAGVVKKVEFNSGRAIGIAAAEAGAYDNIITTVSAMFEFSSQGSAKGKVTSESLKEIQEWRDEDPYIQHILTAGSVVANLANLEEKWLKGGIEYKKPVTTSVTLSGGITQPSVSKPTITKDGVTVDLEKLITAYDEKRIELKVPATNLGESVIFDAADLVMAKQTDRFNKMEQGLLAVYDKKNVLELFDEAQQPGILKLKSLIDQTLKQLRETTPPEGVKKTPDRQLLEGTLHMLLESGDKLYYPSLGLLEKGLYQKTQIQVDNEQAAKQAPARA